MFHVFREWRERVLKEKTEKRRSVLIAELSKEACRALTAGGRFVLRDAHVYSPAEIQGLLNSVSLMTGMHISGSSLKGTIVLYNDSLDDNLSVTYGELKL